jgi:peptidoglycan/xylan/chitin deacetylase (PgdA/CDA1 family)
VAASICSAQNPIIYSNAVRVLGYHDVFVEPLISPPSDVLPDMFRDQMELLQRSGFQVIPMSRVNALISSGTAVPDNAVAITFDDAYRGQYWEAYPILQELGFPATFYVHTNYVGVMTSKDHTTWDELAEKIRAGHDVQSHTVTHPNLATLANNNQMIQLNSELINSRQTIINRLGIPVNQICYPFGGYNPTVIQQALAAGYTYGQTTIGGLNTASTPPMETRRNLLGVGDTLASFSTMLGIDPHTVDGPIILDNEMAGNFKANSASFSQTGFALEGSTQSHRGQHGRNYHRAAATLGNSNAEAIWNSGGSIYGVQRVSAWWPGSMNGAIGQNTGVVYKAKTPEQTWRFVTDQTPQTKGRWVELGVIALPINHSLTISLKNQVASGTHVFADALRFDHLDQPNFTMIMSHSHNIVLESGAEPSGELGTDYGILSSDQPEIIRAFNVFNYGSQPLEFLESPEIIGSSDWSFMITSSSPVPPQLNRSYSIKFQPTTNLIQTAEVVFRTNDPLQPEFRLKLRGGRQGVVLSESFGHTSGWEPFLSTVPGITQNDQDSEVGALLSGFLGSTTAPERQAGWRSRHESNLLVSLMEPGDHLYAKFAVAALAGRNAQAPPPNLRFRIGQRFAVSAVQEVLHHSPNDPEGNRLGLDLRPSSDPENPSVYRLGFEPIRVPYYDSSPEEEIQRTFEAMASDPIQQGYLALVESSLATGRPRPLNQGSLLKNYIKGTGDLTRVVFGSYAVETSQLENLPPGLLPVFLDAAPGAVTSLGHNLPITLDTRGVPGNYIQVFTADLHRGAEGDDDLRNRARIAPDEDYRVRFLVGSEVSPDRNAQIRLRARTAKFVFAQRLELGGVWATGNELTGNAAIAMQAMPGPGTLHPNPEAPGSSRVWYTMIFPSPLDPRIRPEFSPDTPLTVSMPTLGNMDPPGVDQGGLAASRRDILLGIDLIDTLSPGPRRAEETGHVALHEITVHRFPAVRY